MYTAIISCCFLAISASHVALAAPSVQHHGSSDRRLPAAVMRRDMGKDQATAMESGMCMCPCGSSYSVPYSGMHSPEYDVEDSQEGNEYGDYMGSDGGVYDKMQQDADKALKKKYGKLMQKNEKYQHEKDKKREDEMQKKWKDVSVIIEVVHVVIEIDSSGKQKPERYAVSKRMVNTGRDKTTTCHMTAAETITIGEGSCDEGAGSGEASVINSDSADNKMDKNKDQNMGDGHPGMGKMDKPKEKGKMGQSHDADKDKDQGTGKGRQDMENMDKSHGKGNVNDYQDEGKMDAYQDKGKMDGYQDKGKMDGYQDKGKMDGYQDKGKMDKTEKNGEMDRYQRMDKPKDHDMGKGDQDMRKMDHSQDMGETDYSSGMNKDKSTGHDKLNKGHGEMGSQEESSGISQAMSAQGHDNMAQTSKDKAMLIRRQQGGRLGLMFTHFMGSNDTMMIPAYLGAPDPVPGIFLVDDPARDMTYEDEILTCGVDS